MAIEFTLPAESVFGILAAVIALGILALFLLFFWIWSILHCLLTGRLTIGQKILWIVVLLIFNIIGTFIYLIVMAFGGQKEEKMAKKDSFKGKRLTRSKKNRIVAGVCAGLGDYLDIDPTIVRLIWVLLIFFSFGAAILAYIIAWIVIPEK